MTVNVDGLPCEIESIGLNEVVCTTAKKVIDPSAAVPTNYVGQQGLTRFSFPSSVGIWDWRSSVDTDAMTKK